MKKDEKIKLVKNTIADYYELTIEQIEETTRKSEVVKARHIILYMLRYELGLTFREIAEILNKELSTIVRNFQSISDFVYQNKILQKEIKELKDIIKENLKTSV